MGGFKTRESAFRRPSLRYQPVSGWSTYEFDGKEESIDVVMSVAMPMTMENYVTAAVAARVLEKGLAASLSETGMYPKVVSVASACRYCKISYCDCTFLKVVEKCCEKREYLVKT